MVLRASAGRFKGSAPDKVQDNSSRRQALEVAEEALIKVETLAAAVVAEAEGGEVEGGERGPT